MSLEYTHEHENEITLFAETNYRNQKKRFGIKTDDRRRHMYVIGKTGMGKTTLLENLFYSDMANDHGCCYIDPHGDTAEKLIDFVPSHRINDVIYFNPADVDFPMGFNILETESEWQKPLVASGLMGVFKKIWPDVWSPRMEYILMNCVLALLDYPGATLLGINRLLVDKEFRARVVAKIRDPIVKTFWVAEFTAWSEKYATEAIAPVQNKVGQFLSSSVIRNIVAQVKSTLNLRRIMDDGKILVVNLSKGRIGEDNMRLLGGMIITKIQLAAQERQNILEHERRDFYLFVDEFQNFANESFATILSEARKYRLNLIVAHQYIEQLDEKVIPAIFGNVGTILTMRVGGADAEAMEQEFTPVFTPEDLVNLAKTQIYLKLMVDGVATKPFSANTLPPIARRSDSAHKVIQVSRERYAEPRASIEEKVLKWSGMELATSLAGAQPDESGEAAYGLTDPTPAPTIQYPTIRTAEEREAEALAPPPEEKLVPFEAPQVAEWDINTTHDDAEYLTIRPDRMAAISASASMAPGKKKERPQFPHTCSRCGKVWNLPMQLDPTRPMFCADCLPIVREERKQQQDGTRQMVRSFPSQPASAPPARPTGGVMAPPNRPRLVRAPEPAPASMTVVTGEAVDQDDELLGSILQGDRRPPRQTMPSGTGSQPGDEERKKRSRKRKKNRPEGERRDLGPPPRPLPPEAPSLPPLLSLDLDPPSAPSAPPAPQPPAPPASSAVSSGQRLSQGERVTFDDFSL